MFSKLDLLVRHADQQSAFRVCWSACLAITLHYCTCLASMPGHHHALTAYFCDGQKTFRANKALVMASPPGQSCRTSLMMARPAGIAIGAAGKTTSTREGALFASWSAFRAASERSLGGDTRPFYAPPSRAAPLPLVMHSHACLRSFRSVSSHATSHRLAHSVHNGCQQCRWVGTQDHGMRRRRAPHRCLLWCILMRAFARFAPSRRMPPVIAAPRKTAPTTYTLPRRLGPAPQ